MPDRLAHDPTASGGQVYFNFLRPRDFSLRTKHNIEARIDRYEKYYRLFPFSKEAQAIPEEAQQAALDKLQAIIAAYRDLLQSGQWERA